MTTSNTTVDNVHVEAEQRAALAEEGPADRKPSPPCPPEPETPRLLTDAEAVALRLAVNGMRPGSRRDRVESELAAYDAAAKEVQP